MTSSSKLDSGRTALGARLGFDGWLDVREFDAVATAIESDRPAASSLLDSARRHAEEWIVDPVLREDVAFALESWEIGGDL